MADKISASITYLDVNNNKGTKAITDISPMAGDTAIKNFCVGLLGLTTNTLSQIDRVEKTDITNPPTKADLVVTFDNNATNKACLKLGQERLNSYVLNVANNSTPVFTFTQTVVAPLGFSYSPTMDGRILGHWRFTNVEDSVTELIIQFTFNETATSNQTKYRLIVKRDEWATWEKITE